MFRLGNNILINTELKPPAKVATEVYFSGIYASFRLFSLVSSAVAILLFVGFFLMMFSSTLPAAVKIVTTVSTFISIGVISIIGFVGENIRRPCFLVTCLTLLFAKVYTGPDGGDVVEYVHPDDLSLEDQLRYWQCDMLTRAYKALSVASYTIMTSGVEHCIWPSMSTRKIITKCLVELSASMALGGNFLGVIPVDLVRGDRYLVNL